MPNHLDFLCRVVLPGEATAGSLSVIEQRARLGCMTPRHVHAREAGRPRHAHGRCSQHEDA